MPNEIAQPPAVTALAALRAATSSLHAVLDTGLPLARDGAGLADYVSHLRHLRPWLASYLEAERDLGDAVDRRHLERKQALLSRIDADLHHAGTADGVAARHQPLSADLALLMHDAAYRRGVDYVIEGSQLGGSVMYRRFSQAFAPHPLTYLRGDGADTGARWRAFMGELDAAVRTPGDIVAACRGAVDAFRRLMASFGMDTEPERQTRSELAA